MYEDKKPGKVNLEYFMEHADEIIQDTEHIITPFGFPSRYTIDYEDEVMYPGITEKIKELHDSHLYMWMMFGSGPGDSWSNEELIEIDRKYCEDTGRWELFIWK